MSRDNRGTYWSGGFDRYLRHADVRLVEVLDSLGGYLGRLVAYIANSTLGDKLDISDFTVAGREVFAELGLGDTRGKSLDEYS
jgi:hypothetical protein